ncbi:MAG: PD-(D/E)XK nuclease domain-containing protein [Syntrophus sp. (in: bacteria)]|nr:PD-(D/E)XK nuclease domain-containing protein [Syntrophus sp. (in: bacteria)]
MILYYLSNTYEQGEPPELLLDMNIASDYGKLARIMRLKSPESNIQVLKDIIYTGEVSAQITPQFSMEKDFTRDDFTSLLYYLGLLTIKRAIPGEVILHIPNYVIRGLYYDFFTTVISEEGSFAIQPERIREAMREIGYEGACTKLVVLIKEILHAFSNRDYIGFDEKYIKVLLFTYAHMSNLYLVKSEYEVPGGYIDIVLIPRRPWKPDYYAMFELKYLKSGASERKIQEITEEGIGQLKRYSMSSEFSDVKNLKKWVLVFVGDRCVTIRDV